MLAEIFLLKLEAIARTPSGSGRPVSDPRFVPVALQAPVKK